MRPSGVRVPPGRVAAGGAERGGAVKIEVRALGPVTLEVDGVPAALSPSEARVLALLVAADGSPVTVSSLHRELWPTSLDSTHRKRQSRTDIQKRIFSLRRAMDPLGTGQAEEVLRTEMIVSGAVTESAYRLVLDAEKLDCARFEERVDKAMTQAHATAAVTLSEALSLWTGSPLTEAGDAPFAQARVRRLKGLYETACSELVQIRMELGQLDAALPLAERIAARQPDDPEATGRVEAVRARLRDRRGDQVLQREFPGLRARLLVVRGDLFDQREANLVVGFTDTFDTSTERNELISAQSVQGQLLHRLYGGDASVLDRELRRGLRRVVPVGRENPQDKPKGKRVRYPVGTVVPLPHEERWIFAVAYSRQGNDLLGRSSPDELRLSLKCLWNAVALRGQLRPVAIPLVGSGLARIHELNRTQLAAMIVETFAAAQRDRASVSPELRIVIRPQDVDTADLHGLARFIESLDQDGRPESD
jgi:DNA-binding SARP family transcriptional activator